MAGIVSSVSILWLSLRIFIVSRLIMGFTMVINNVDIWDKSDVVTGVKILVNLACAGSKK